MSLDPITPGTKGAAAVEPFMKSFGINYTNFIISAAEALAGYDVRRGIPTTYVLDRNGRVARVFVGMRSMPVLEEAIKKLL